MFEMERRGYIRIGTKALGIRGRSNHGRDGAHSKVSATSRYMLRRMSKSTVFQGKFYTEP